MLWIQPRKRGCPKEPPHRKFERLNRLSKHKNTETWVNYSRARTGQTERNHHRKASQCDSWQSDEPDSKAHRISLIILRVRADEDRELINGTRNWGPNR